MGSRRPLIAGNWKMFLDASSSVALAREVQQRVSRCRTCDIVLLPAFPLIPGVAKVIEEGPIAIGSQDISAEVEGAFTGEVNAKMLLSLGCTFATIGHSERREHHLEMDEYLHRKVVRALDSGLIPIYCVGERLSERDAGQTLMRIERQISVGLGGLTPEQMGKVVIAYEPVWAIGTGRVATPAQAEEVHEFIRGQVRRMFGDTIANELRILYGGSVKPDNVRALMAEKDVDGALVGGASLSAESFASIVNFQE